MTTRKSKPPMVYRRLRVYISSAVIGSIAAGVALLLFALLVFLLQLPLEYSGFFSILAFAIGCFASGFAAGVLKRQGGLRSGVYSALMFALPIVMIGFLWNGFSMLVFNQIVIAALCGSMGGVLGVNRNGGF